MNTFQRALRSVTRKPIKSALLLLVIVTVSLLLLCGMACQNASIQTQDSTRQAVGAGLRLDANEANRSKRLDECVKQIGDSMEGSYGGVHMEILENGFGTQLLVYTDNSFESLDTADIDRLQFLIFFPQPFPLIPFALFTALIFLLVSRTSHSLNKFRSGVKSLSAPSPALSTLSLTAIKRTPF